MELQFRINMYCLLWKVAIVSDDFKVMWSLFQTLGSATEKGLTQVKLSFRKSCEIDDLRRNYFDDMLRCRISESKFIQFSEVENHDDFYSYEDSRVHVQDQRGFYIMYDAAVEDFR